jgi:6-phosphogluconolactonase/glucosamine-6-phosphate isomerase/deaminase
VAAQAPVEPHVRLTLTLPALTRARAVFVLVAGATEAEALRHVLEGAGDWIKHPAAGIQLANGPVIWWADGEAAALAPDEREFSRTQPRRVSRFFGSCGPVRRRHAQLVRF